MPALGTPALLRHNPYRIDGPALVSFSGGRTSGYMLAQILDAWDGRLPDDVHVVFANTGKEMPETLDFVSACGDRLGVRIVWLEWRAGAEGQRDGFEVVNHNSAARNGEPFKALIDRRGFLPNPVTRFCTADLKIKTMQRYMQSVADGWWNVVGLRADEQRRVARMRANADLRAGCAGNVLPLADAGATVTDVGAFWACQPFDLALPAHGGKTPLGNCDLCFLKGAATIFGIVRDRPDLAEWWIKAEAEARASAPNGAVFRQDRPSYAALLRIAQDQGDLFCGFDDTSLPCGCHD